MKLLRGAGLADALDDVLPARKPRILFPAEDVVKVFRRIFCESEDSGNIVIEFRRGRDGAWRGDGMGPTPSELTARSPCDDARAESSHGFILGDKFAGGPVDEVLLMLARNRILVCRFMIAVIANGSFL